MFLDITGAASDTILVLTAASEEDIVETIASKKKSSSDVSVEPFESLDCSMSSKINNIMFT